MCIRDRFYSLATWGNAGILREQVCKYMCPYARFQSAMFDRDTLIIAYDPLRGEPRGPRKKGLASVLERARGLLDVRTAYDYVFRSSQHPSAAQARIQAAGTVMLGDIGAVSYTHLDVYKRQEKTFAPYKGQAIDVLAQNPQALKLGKSIFANTCATCHGSSAKGAVGYPNLTDTIWHWGGSPDQILHTVLNGREGVMPAWGKTLQGMGGPDAVDYVICLLYTSRCV